MVSSALPRFISLSFPFNAKDEFNQDVHLYARCIVQQDGAMNGFLSFGDPVAWRENDGVRSPQAKFEVELANTGRGELVHIRSCHNNMYLRKASENSVTLGLHWLAASANAREEDQTKWSSTLFRPILVSSSSSSSPSNSLTYRFRLLCNGTEMDIRHGNHPSDPSSLCLAADVHNRHLVYPVVDLASLAIVPSFVTFKGDNGKYLRMGAATGTVPNAVQFTGEDQEDRCTHFEAVTTREGSVLIKSRFLAPRDNYLVVSPASGFVSASFTANQAREGLFYPVRLSSRGGDPNVIALIHVLNNMYCRRSTGAIVDGLSATAVNVVAECQLNVNPAVRAREVYNVQFMPAKIYDLVPVNTMSKVVVNGSTDTTQEAELSFVYREHESESWNTSHSWQVGVSWNSTLSARLPVLRFIRGEVSVSLDAGYQGEHNWGKEVERTTEVETKFRVSVPPYTRSRVLMVVSDAKIDVPFSYTQRDTLLDWGTSLSKEEDGHFESEGTHIDFEVVDEPLATQSALN